MATAITDAEVAAIAETEGHELLDWGGLPDGWAMEGGVGSSADAVVSGSGVGRGVAVLEESLSGESGVGGDSTGFTRFSWGAESAACELWAIWVLVRPPDQEDLYYFHILSNKVGGAGRTYGGYAAITSIIITRRAQYEYVYGNWFEDGEYSAEVEYQLDFRRTGEEWFGRFSGSIVTALLSLKQEGSEFCPREGHAETSTVFKYGLYEGSSEVHDGRVEGISEGLRGCADASNNFTSAMEEGLRGIASADVLEEIDTAGNYVYGPLAGLPRATYLLATSNFAATLSGELRRWCRTLTCDVATLVVLMALLPVFGGCTDGSGDSDTAKPASLTLTGARGTLLLFSTSSGQGDDFECTYTLDTSAPTDCTQDGCTWAFDIGGRYTFHRLDGAVPDYDGSYTFTMEYLVDYHGYPTLSWTDENGTMGGLVGSFVEVTWSSDTTATLSSLPVELGGCPYRGNEPREYCEWGGDLTLLME